jgi:hypothetical protein
MIQLNIATITVLVGQQHISFKDYLKDAKVRKLSESGLRLQTELKQTRQRMPVLMKSIPKDQEELLEILREYEFASEAYGRKYVEKHFDIVPKGCKYDVMFTDVRFSSKLHYTFKD